MKSIKLFAFLPLLAVLVSCGGKNPTGPSSVPTTVSGAKSVPDTITPGTTQIVLTDNGVQVPNATYSLTGNVVKATAPGYINSTEVSLKPVATQMVDLWKIPSGWTQQDVIDIVYKDNNSDVLFPLGTPENRPVVLVPVAGTDPAEIAMLTDAVAYMTAATGYDIHVIGAGESIEGKAVFSFSVDPALAYNGITHWKYSGMSIVGGSVTVRPGVGPGTFRHELGHAIGLNHLRTVSGLMLGVAGHPIELSPGELSVVAKRRVRPVGTTAPDIEPGLTATSAAVGMRTFTCW